MSLCIFYVRRVTRCELAAVGLQQSYAAELVGSLGKRGGSVKYVYSTTGKVLFSNSF